MPIKLHGIKISNLDIVEFRHKFLFSGIMQPRSTMNETSDRSPLAEFRESIKGMAEPIFSGVLSRPRDDVRHHVLHVINSVVHLKEHAQPLHIGLGHDLARPV